MVYLDTNQAAEINFSVEWIVALMVGFNQVKEPFLLEHSLSRKQCIGAQQQQQQQEVCTMHRNRLKVLVRKARPQM